MPQSIYNFVKEEENNFEADEIRLGDNWHWNMREHLQMIYHLKNSRFYSGENDWMRAFRNVMEPVLNLSMWSEDIEVKDIVFFIENKHGRVLSFLLKKYHDDVFARKHNIDAMLDNVIESDLEYGGVLVQKDKKGLPKVLDMTSLAFADQTDILGGPFGFKMTFSPDKLRQMEKQGWGKEENGATISIQDLITLASEQKDAPGESEGKPNQVPGKAIEVYIVRGSMPEHYLKDNEEFENHFDQVQIIAYYNDKDNKKQGVTLFRKKQNSEQVKFFSSKPIDGRALGRGVGEQMLHPQIWSNFLEIHKTKMMEAASKVPLYTDDESYTQRNTITDMENLEVTTVAQGSRIDQVPTAAPANIQLFEGEIDRWFQHAQQLGAAFDPLMGEQPPSGSTFRGQQKAVQQGRGLHDRRRGQRAKFIEELYRDWIIPEMRKEILDGAEFMATLSMDEFRWLVERMAESFAAKTRIEEVLEGKTPTPRQELIDKFREKIRSRGNKFLMKIIKDEFRNEDIQVGINVANKQKDLADLSDKVLSIFQFVFSNPDAFQQAMQNPSLAKAFQDILEFSGMNQADFASLMETQPVQQQQQQQQQQGQQQNAQQLQQQLRQAAQ